MTSRAYVSKNLFVVPYGEGDEEICPSSGIQKPYQNDIIS